jgi:hypothetical protein
VAPALWNDWASKHAFNSRLCIERAGRNTRLTKARQIIAPAGKHAVLVVIVRFYIIAVFPSLRGSEELNNASDRFFQRHLGSGTVSRHVPGK